MPNHLLIPMMVNPNATIETFWQSFENATVVGVEIFGLSFAFNLEPTPYGIQDKAPPNVTQAFWLGSDVKKGVVEACLRGCDHSTIKTHK